MIRAGVSFCAVAVLALSFAFVSDSVSLSEQIDAHASRVLMLRNGQVLGGTVTLAGDFYLVTLPRGEVRVRIDEVERVCGSLAEGYVHRRAAIRFGTADDHLRLARWCVEYGLLSEADAELKTAKALNPHHSRLRSVAQQLDSARRPTPVATTENTEFQRDTEPEELDTFVRTMPSGSVESFTKSVQPVLLNGCSARACHGSGADNEFRLFRYARGQLPPRRITLRNLKATMRWTDSVEPGASRLLQAAVEPHGPNSTAVLKRGSKPYRRLVEWVEKVHFSDRQQPRPNRLAGPAPTLSQAISVTNNHTSAIWSQDAQTPGSEVGTSQGSSEEGFRRKDPFDPEIFNRRYHPSKP